MTKGIFHSSDFEMSLESFKQKSCILLKKSIFEKLILLKKAYGEHTMKKNGCVQVALAFLWRSLKHQWWPSDCIFGQKPRKSDVEVFQLWRYHSLRIYSWTVNKELYLEMLKSLRCNKVKTTWKMSNKQLVSFTQQCSTTSWSGYEKVPCQT